MTTMLAGAWVLGLDLDEVAGGTRESVVALVTDWRKIADLRERAQVEREVIGVALDGSYPAEVEALRPDEREVWKSRAIDAVRVALYEACDEAEELSR